MAVCTITCPHCGFSKKVETGKISSKSVTVRCPACQRRFRIDLSGLSAKPRMPAEVRGNPQARPAEPQHQPKSFTTPKSDGSPRKTLLIILVVLLGMVAARFWLDHKARSVPYPYWLAASDRGIAVLYGNEFYIVDQDGTIQWSQVLPAGAVPCQILWHGDEIWISDWKHHCIRSYANGRWETIALNGPKIDAHMNVAVEPGSGYLLVSDSQGGRILVFDSDGRFLKEFGERGRSPGQLFFPKDVAFDSSGRFLVGNTLRPAVDEFNTDGTFVQTTIQPQGNPFFPFLSDFAVGDQNIVTIECNALITDCLVADYDRQGKLLQTTHQVPGAEAAGDVAVWGEHVYVSDCLNRGVNVFTLKDLERIGPLSAELDARGQELSEKASLYRQLSNRSIYLIVLCFIIMLWFYRRSKRQSG